MRQVEVDALLKSDSFRERLREADRLHGAYLHFGLLADSDSEWATRVVWVALTEGVPVARRFAVRRSSYRTSLAWQSYGRLVARGLVNAERDCLHYVPTAPWEGAVFTWILELIRACSRSGHVLPAGFPVVGGV